MQKMKAPAIRGIQFHNQRERESETNPDIEKEKSNLNYDLVNTGKIDYVEAVKERIEEGVESSKKIRKDAVRLCEFLITSDKDFFENLSEKDEEKFFEKGYEFLKERYGAANIIYATVHKDERTPHMHVGFVPITEDKRLSAKDLFSKLDLVKLQDDFHKHMNEAGFNLERGVSSNREHLDTARYKAQTLHDSVKELGEKKEKLVDEVKAKNFEVRSKNQELYQTNKRIEEKSQEYQEKSANLERIQKEIQKVEVPLNNLNSIKASKVLGRVTLKENDFNHVMKLAKQSLNQDQEKIDLQKENKELKIQAEIAKKSLEHKDQMFDTYFKENVKLKRENRKLLQERNKFQKLYDFAISFFKNTRVYEQTKNLFEAKEKEIEREQKQQERELERG